MRLVWKGFCYYWDEDTKAVTERGRNEEEFDYIDALIIDGLSEVRLQIIHNFVLRFGAHIEHLIF